MKEIFPGVFREGKRLYTKNATPGASVYGEQLKKEKDDEYREWIVSRSKLAAALANNLRTFPFAQGSKVLYLGASTGTTPSHISDIIGSSGLLYAIEFSERMFRSLGALAKRRNNIAPLLLDARKPEQYLWIEECDIVYVDIAQPDQTDVAIRNANIFLKKHGHMFISIKSQSIDVTKPPKEVFEQEKMKLENSGYKVFSVIDLEPHEEKHAMIIVQK